MAFDLIEQPSKPAALPLRFGDEDANKRVRPGLRPSIKWRQTVLAIVYDSLNQIEMSRTDDTDHLWRREARQRALNFTRLGLAEITLPDKRMIRSNQPGWDIAAVATLGGAYRLLAKCEGFEPVQCEHIFRRFLKNLALAYAPVCGEAELAIELCPILLAPLKCRALILCVGMLIQGMMRLSYPGRISFRLDVALSADATQYALALEVKGRRIDLMASPEFDLASRLCGVFHADLRIHGKDADKVAILLAFPAADRSQ